VTNRRLACIDIGSNTTRLLIADRTGSELAPVHQERAFTRIGEELLTHGHLRPAKIAEVAQVVLGQVETAGALGVQEVRAVATAAIRAAGNGQELVDAVREASGVRVEILSDQEEARLAFVGVAGTLETPPAGELGVVDVGGGSSELAVGVAPQDVRWWASLPVGSASLARSSLATDPPTREGLEVARGLLAAQFERLEVPRPGLAVAVGGSATSLARLIGPILGPGPLQATLELLLTAPAAEIAARYELETQRVRLLPAGLLILEGVARAFGTALIVGRGGMREGVLLQA
jgi:exopolyphosphatase/guanosine-5'-triphosphate,3'-diphosphate pyrophosphatase